MSDRALAVLGLVLGILGIVIGFAASYYFYIKGRERVDPRYILTCGPLLGNINNTMQRVSLLVNEEKFEHLNRCLLVLWNKGSRTLRGGDIVDRDQVRVVFPAGSRTLDASVIDCTRQSIGLTAIIDENDRNVLIKFDFLDRGDGGVIQVLYQGDPELRPEVTGSIKGAPEGFRVPAISGNVDFSDEADREDSGTWGSWSVLIVVLLLFVGCSSAFFGFSYPLTVVLLTLLTEILVITLTGSLFGIFVRRSIDFPKFGLRPGRK